MLIESRNWHQHRPWVIITLVLTILATVWYFVWSHNKSDWPGGSSLPGFTFGLAGGLIILFEMLLWWRKKVRTWRIGRVQGWMRAHIWLGLLSVPLLILHSGFRLGGELAAILMILFLVVIASGIWGLICQQFLPRWLLAEVPAETIYSQIDHVAGHLILEAERLVLATCGRDPNQPMAKAGDNNGEDDPKPYMTLGSVRSAGKVQGKVIQTRVPSAPVPGTEVLRDFYQATLEPFLRQGRQQHSPLGQPTEAATLFRNLRINLDKAAHDSVNALEELCDQRRQFDHQERLHFWLHCWLWVHLPLSLALVVLMVVHGILACKYW
jgi:hypothetical protein